MGLFSDALSASGETLLLCALSSPAGTEIEHLVGNALPHEGLDMQSRVSASA